MFTRIVFLLLVSTLFFASCTKESITLPTEEIEATIKERSTTVEIEVSEISSSDNGTELFLDFSANFDFSEAIVEPIQYLTFSDGAGNTSTLSFSVNSYTGNNGSLQIEFTIGSNNLAGLDLTSIQNVIIDDLHIE